MRIISVEATNFASYKKIEMTFVGYGLCLISGPTGSGKSTLCDLVPWVLFGRTAKDGAVDEIRSWNTDEPTTGLINIELSNGNRVSIFRSRAPNDLWFECSTETTDTGHEARGDDYEERGKDLNDTQKLINDLLGFNVDTYLNGAYFHEFCQSAQFFITSAKNRRAITEQLVDLSLATDLQDKAKISTKDLKAAISQTTTLFNNAKTSVHTLSNTVNNAERLAASWEVSKEVKLYTLYESQNSFEDERKERLTELVVLSDKVEYENNQAQESVKTGVCPTCGNQYSKTHAPHKKANPYTKMIDKLLNDVNTYREQAIELINEQNPHTLDQTDVLALEEAKDSLALYTEALRELNQELTDLELLLDVVNDFRGVLIKNTIVNLESDTNNLLTTYFDAEIRVGFSVADADKLDVAIFKDANECTYTQLSKGQRQLLKLCFGIAVMKSVSNQQGVHFDQIFFDEATDGLDETFKLKAVQMLESLALNHSSVFLVEHSSAIKAMIPNQIEVALVNGASILEQTN